MRKRSLPAGKVLAALVGLACSLMAFLATGCYPDPVDPSSSTASTASAAALPSIGLTTCDDSGATASDINGDGVVNFTDLATMKSQFFKPGGGTADLNGDGVVNFGDLAILKKNFFKTTGCSKATVYAVTPTENRVGDEVYVMGREFDAGSIHAVLEDPDSPLAVFPPVDVVSVSPNSVVLAIPHFETARHRFRLSISQDDGTGMKPARLAKPPEMPVAVAPYLYLRSADAAAHDVPIKIQLMNWSADFIRNPVGGEYPYPGMLLYNRPPFPYPDWGKDDSWFGWAWSDLKPVFEQASRDWATICGRVWAPGIPVGINGLEEVVPRTTLSWAPYMVPEVEDPGIMIGMMTGTMVWFRSSYEDHSPNTQDLLGKVVGTPCQTNAGAIGCPLFVGMQPGVVLVHVVWRMTEGGARVDPLSMFRGKTFPQYGNMILVSSNPFVTARPDFPVGTTLPIIPPLLPGVWDKNPLKPATPNILAHEVVHYFDLVDPEIPMPMHVNVSDPYDLLIPRGYALGAPGVPISADCLDIAAQAGRGGF